MEEKKLPHYMNNIDDHEDADVGKMHEHLGKEAKEIAFRHFDSKHHEVIKDYKDRDYGPINDRLRSPLTREEVKKEKSHGWNTRREQIKSLSNVTKHGTQQDFHTYRALNPEYAKRIINGKPGTVAKDKAFVSTSVDPKHTRNVFGITERETSHIHMARIHVTPGTKGHYLDAHQNSNNDEKEFLIHKGTSFKIHSHTFDPKHGGIHYVNLEVHKQEK